MPLQNLQITVCFRAGMDADEAHQGTGDVRRKMLDSDTVEALLARLGAENPMVGLPILNVISELAEYGGFPLS